MDYFDASEELYHTVQEFIRVHDGEHPNRVYVSPMLYDWLVQMQREERLLKGLNTEGVQLTTFQMDFGPLPLVVDELLSDYEIIPE